MDGRAHEMDVDFDAPHPALDSQLDRAINAGFRKRTAIRVSDNIKASVDLSIVCLKNYPNVYKRDGKLVQTANVADFGTSALAVGVPQIHELQLPKLKSIMSDSINFEVYDRRAEDYVSKVPPNDIVAAVFADVHLEGIPELVGIIEAPTMRADGTVLDVPGYDASTRLLYAPCEHYPAVPDSPTHEDAKRALELLQEPWVNFPVTSESGKALPVAALMTIVCRSAIAGSTPAFVFDASTAGSGKTLQAKCVSIIANGRAASMSTWPTESTEIEKMMASYALEGAGTVLFDNVTAPMGGGTLDKVLTAGSGPVSFRVLGKSKIVSAPWRAAFIATGNNVQIVADTARRTLIQRLETGCERPEERDHSKYKHPDLTAWCAENRAQLVVAALTLLRAYFVAGKPKQSIVSWASFQEWTDTIASAIVWAGGPNMLEARATVATDEDLGTMALRTLVKEWQRFAPEGITAKGALDALYTPDFMRGNAAPDGWDDLRSAIEELAPPGRSGHKPDSGKLGLALRKVKRRVLGGLTIDSKLNRNDVQVWSVKSAGAS